MNNEPIDFVVTWVDGNDPEWQRQRQRYQANPIDNGDAPNRFRDWGLLRYWFRGVEAFAPWVHRVYFVTCGQRPDWLNVNHPKLTLVDHRDYIPHEHLPTFNSTVIELYLHRIPGLSEQFVLFNDDVYLTAPTRPEDFFRGGLPCESALLDTITANDPGNLLPYLQVNNFGIINRRFQKREVLRKNAGKFFTWKYGRELSRNLLLAPFQHFSCFRDPHLTSAYLKRTFQEVWDEEGALLEASGMERFRSRMDYSHWLMKAWQICEGNFVPRPTSWGRHFELHEDSQFNQAIEKQTYHAICLNDSYMTVDFEGIQPTLVQSFQKILPEPSAFECDSAQTPASP
ncbi:MAG: Stealth CR1 domain-containing protein [Clostridiales bacterium]|nr:Stealth CR1 domain-containing protein [Clostridiales bacterium]